MNESLFDVHMALFEIAVGVWLMLRGAGPSAAKSAS